MKATRIGISHLTVKLMRQRHRQYASPLRDTMLDKLDANALTCRRVSRLRRMRHNVGNINKIRPASVLLKGQHTGLICFLIASIQEEDLLKSLLAYKQVI